MRGRDKEKGHNLFPRVEEKLPQVFKTREHGEVREERFKEDARG